MEEKNMNQGTVKTKLIPVLALAFLMVVPMFLATMPVVKASNDTTPVLSVVLSSTTSTRLIPAKPIGSTFSVDVRVDNTSGVNPGINSYSYGLTWNPAVLNVTNVNDAFSGSFLNSGANLGTVESLGDLPANNTEGLLIIGDIILNTSYFAACVTGSGVLTTVTFEVKAAGQSAINLQPSDVGVAYLTYPDSQGNSHDVVANTANATYIPPIWTPSSEVGITGYKLVLNTTLTNSLGTPQSINYSWSYEVYTYNVTTKTYSIAVTSGVTPTVTGYFVPTSTSTIQSLERNAVLPTTLSWNDSIEVFGSFVYTLSGNTYTLALPATLLNVHPGDITGKPVTFPYLGADGVVNIKDGALVGAYWGNTVPAGTNPETALARADILGLGVINIKAGALVGSEWGRNW
jgi:hypothetical protein